MSTPKELSKEISKKVENNLKYLKKYYGPGSEIYNIDEQNYTESLHDLLSFQVSKKNFDVSSLDNFISSVIDFQKDRYDDRSRAWSTDIEIFGSSTAGYGDFIEAIDGIETNFDKFVIETGVELFNSGKGSIADLKVFFGLFIGSPFINDPDIELSDLNAYENVEYGPFEISNPRPLISSNYGFCRRGYEDHIYLDFDKFDKSSLSVLYQLYNIIDFEKDTEIREELIANGIKPELLKDETINIDASQTKVPKKSKRL